MENDHQDIRATIVLPKRRMLVGVMNQAMEQPLLHTFRGTMQSGENSEDGAHRIVADYNQELQLGLPRLKTYLALGAIDGIVGFALYPPVDSDVNLRHFTVKGSDSELVLEQIALIEAGKYVPSAYDPIDLEFIRRSLTRTPSA